MQHPFIISIVLGFLSLPAIAGAVTAESGLDLQGRSIPENSISISAPPVSADGSIIIVTADGIVGKPFVLDGTKSQDDGVVRTYYWRQVDGPKVVLSSATSLTLSVVPSFAGTYVFELVATDSTGRASVAKRHTITVDVAGPSLGVALPPPPVGDPDFDLKLITPKPVVQYNETNLEFIQKTAPSPSPISVGDINRDGVADVVTTKVSPPRTPTLPEASQTNPAIIGGDRSRSPDIAVTLDGSMSNDPDFDLLNIRVGGDDLANMRDEVSSTDTTKKVIVRGWDPKKKEEIVARPLDVKTTDDLKVYVEAVALSDTEIKDIKIKKDVIEVKSREQRKLFGLIPVHLTRTVLVSFNLKDSSIDPVDVDFSWWHVFVKKAESSEDLSTALVTELNLLKMEDMKRVRSESTISMYAETLQRISNVLKTKHDTAKNSIGNIR